MADTCVSDETPPAKFTELKCFNCQSCPPPGSADRFNDTANLTVNTGFMLQKEASLAVRDKRLRQSAYIPYTLGGVETVNSEQLSFKLIIYSQV